MGVGCGGEYSPPPEPAPSLGAVHEEGTGERAQETWNGSDVTTLGGGIVLFEIVPTPFTPGSKFQFCTGVVYQKKWIITARHCFTNQAHDAKVKLSDVDITFSKDALSESDIRRLHFPTLGPPDLAIMELKTNYKVGGKEVDNKTILSNKAAYTLTELSKDSKVPRVNCYGYGPDAFKEKTNNPKSRILRMSSFWADRISSKKAYEAYYDFIANSPGGTKVNDYKESRTCEGKELLFGVACNRLLNPPKEQTTQQQQLSEGDSGGPCFLSSSDWQEQKSDIKPRELVGIAQMNIEVPTNNYDIFVGSSFSTNIDFYRKSIENITMNRGFASRKSSLGPKGPGIGWLVDINGDFKLDYVKVKSNEVAFSLNEGANTFSTAQIFPISAPVEDNFYFGYLNDDWLIDGVYLNEDILTSFFSQTSGGIPKLIPQFPTFLPPLGETSWSNSDVWLIPLLSNAYDLVRVEKDGLYSIPNTGTSFDTGSLTSSLVSCPGCGDAYESDFEYLDTKDFVFDYFRIFEKSIVVKEGLPNRTWGVEKTFPMPISCAPSAFKDIVDLNADGLADFICIDETQSVTLLSQVNKPFSMARATTFEFVSDWNKRATLVDMNKDNLLDIVFVESNILPYASSINKFPFIQGDMYVKYGTSTGEFSTATKISLAGDISYALGFQPFFSASDMDGDGNVEIFSPSWYDDKVWVTNTFTPFLFQWKLFL